MRLSKGTDKEEEQQKGYRKFLRAYIKRRQMIIFCITYITHSFSELGATNELVTATFYRQQYLGDIDEKKS